MKRTAQVVLLCEDEQHSVFMYRFFKRMGWNRRQLRIEKASRSKGSAEQFVRERFPHELQAYRRDRNRVSCMLAVMIDGDNSGVEARHSSLVSACKNIGVLPRQDGEKVAIFVPTWNIETWLTYLSGEDVTEEHADYPKLARARDCQNQVKSLADICQQGTLEEPVPPSLKIACDEYNNRLD